MKQVAAALAAGMTMVVPLSSRGGEPTPATDLEQVTVYATRPGITTIGAESVPQATLQQFGRATLDEAVLLSAGTSVSAVGARNETNVWIRGFDRWRVPLYQDGIPVYLPVDNRIDFGRFTTADLAEIQVSKGFASVIDGPGAMGGSINLASRLAAKPLEADGRIGVLLNSRETYEGWNSDVFLERARAAGSRREPGPSRRKATSACPTTIRPERCRVPATGSSPPTRTTGSISRAGTSGRTAPSTH